MGRLADFFRLAWGYLYWNTRKSVFRLRAPGSRTHARCPCQHPSDSGRAFETACSASAGWNDPARFRRLCPLLKQNEAGLWRCSVNSPDVRPFWGRACAFYGTALATTYLLATLAAFVVLRRIGYEVTYPGVLWPPAWSHLREIRARYFISKYQAAASAGDMQTALLSLSTAYALNPGEYAIGRQLAQAWQVAQPALSDQIYQRLVDQHPSEAESTSQAWFHALLARGDFTGLERLSASRLTADAASPGPWLNAFLFANRLTRNETARRKLADAPRLAPDARSILQVAERVERAHTREEIRNALTTAASNASSPASFYQVCRYLIAYGFAQDALQWLDNRRELLGARDALPLRLDALATLGWDAALNNEIETLLIPPPSAPVTELLSAHLIRHPHVERLRLLSNRVQRSPLPPAAESYSAYLSLFCAAGVGSDKPLLDWSATRVREIVGSNFRGLDAVAQVLLDERRARHIENYLPALQPLPLEVAYALFEHYASMK